MTRLLLLGLLVGLDNLQVGVGFGLRRWTFAGGFLLCETVIPLIEACTRLPGDLT